MFGLCKHAWKVCAVAHTPPATFKLESVSGGTEAIEYLLTVAAGQTHVTQQCPKCCDVRQIHLRGIVKREDLGLL
jgi:hypothetical protein